MADAVSNAPSQIISVIGREWEALSPTIKVKKLWSDPSTRRRAQITMAAGGTDQGAT